MRALITVDLGFGDAGKGLLTDFLVRRTGANVVVRYNGGAQAGHNVVTPHGQHHTFSQFGSGTFVPGVRTFLSRDVVVHPTALLYEASRLVSVGVPDALDRLHISANALVITPYHQALGRMREIARGDGRHGSCGVGVGETVAHDLRRLGDAIRARDLRDVRALRRKLYAIREQTWSEVPELGAEGLAAQSEIAIFQRPEVLTHWIEQTRDVARLVADDDTWLPRADERATVIFEGAQGVLLDEWHGFHPYTTWSSCTSASATRLISELVPGADVFTIGILRSYAVRHGPGPFPTETADATNTPPEHNTLNEWQGGVRRGWFDAVLARYAIAADRGIDALAITHLDWLPRLSQWTYCDRYSPHVPLHPNESRSLEQQEQLTARLASARPELRHCAANEEAVLATIEGVLETPVAFGSRGPSASHVFVRSGDFLVPPTGWNEGSTRTVSSGTFHEMWGCSSVGRAPRSQ